MKRSRSTFHLYDRILDGQLGPLLAAWRAEEPPASLVEIVVRLHDLGVDVSAESVRRWIPLVEAQQEAS